MNIGTINIRGFNSLTNAMMQNTEEVPEVGMGATILMYTDRHAATIVAVRKNKDGIIKSVDIQEDNATRTDTNGMSESQDYSYQPNLNAKVRTFTLRKNGRWVEKDSGTMWNGTKLSIGIRDHYYDYSF